MSSKASEQLVISAKANVMIYDNVNKKWNPSGSGPGLSKVQIYQNLLNQTYHVVGLKLQDHEVVINCQLAKGLLYSQANQTFLQWRDTKHVYGLQFQSKDEAEIFTQTFKMAVDNLNHLASLIPTAHHQMNMHNNNNNVSSDNISIGKRSISSDYDPIYNENETYNMMHANKINNNVSNSGDIIYNGNGSNNNNSNSMKIVQTSQHQQLQQQSQASITSLPLSSSSSLTSNSLNGGLSIAITNQNHQSTMMNGSNNNHNNNGYGYHRQSSDYNNCNGTTTNGIPTTTTTTTTIQQQPYQPLYQSSPIPPPPPPPLGGLFSSSSNIKTNNKSLVLNNNNHGNNNETNGQKIYDVIPDLNFTTTPLLNNSAPAPPPPPPLPNGLFNNLKINNNNNNSSDGNASINSTVNNVVPAPPPSLTNNNNSNNSIQNGSNNYINEIAEFQQNKLKKTDDAKSTINKPQPGQKDFLTEIKEKIGMKAAIQQQLQSSSSNVDDNTNGIDSSSTYKPSNLLIGAQRIKQHQQSTRPNQNFDSSKAIKKITSTPNVVNSNNTISNGNNIVATNATNGGSVNGSSTTNGSTKIDSTAFDFEKFKQELVLEFRKELQIFKSDIVNTIINDFKKQQQN